ncbi:DoxX family protein [Micromonospora echinofusca]|uniref:DoxX family membrane protein n=1 Tax=Micromonospora echinofusca TaxID=47858 RepID=A0ABS3VZ74_MICEH|nr:DoxX family protein [Micromonospora echinofusca]MBO4209832.1 DoxX family membrane protein [Micromonospora echinofusca]
MTANRLADPVITLFRVVVGLLFVLHGAASLFGVFGGARGSGQALEFGVWPGWWAALIQFVGGLLVLVGLGTRIAAVVCSGSMAYAYFVVHQPSGLLPMNNGGELAALFCWSFLLIAVVGPGRWALDSLLARRTGTARRSELVTTS